MLIAYVVDRLWHKFEGVAYVNTFTSLRMKYDQVCEVLPQ